MTKVEKPEWLKLKELHDAEMITTGGHGRGGPERPRSFGATYGPTESRVDQIGDGLIDVNDLMKRFDKMPTPEQLAQAGITTGGMYIDQTGDPELAGNAQHIAAEDFEQALQITNLARARFALFPASFRERFDNDPKRFLAWADDPRNDEEMVTLGLKVKKPTKEPEVTLKDVRDAIKDAANPKKTAGKGGDTDEE